MTNESQMKPKDWADAHGLKVDVVMKLLRDAGVAVRTHMSKLDMADFAKIEDAAAAEKQKQDARNKNLKRPTASESDSSASAPAKKKETSVATNRLGLKVSLKKGPGPRKEAPKPAAKQDVKPSVAKIAASAAVKPAAPAPAQVAPKPAAPAPAQVAPAAPAPKPAAPAPAPAAAPAAPAVKPAAPAPAPAPQAKPAAPAPAHAAPKPAAPAPAAKPAAPAVAKPAAPQPTMMSATTELKQPPMKAQVFKPDAAILARIEKSRQQAQAARNNHRPNGGNRNGGNGQGYTGTFGRLSNNGNGGNDNRNNNNNNRRPNGGNASSSSRGYTGRNGGFSSGSMQEAFNASNNNNQSLGQNNQNGKGNGKGQNGRHGNDKNRRSNTKDRQEMQREQQQEAVRQNVSRVMASLSKNPVKKVYHKEHSENNSGEEKKILKTSDFITVGELAGLMDQMPARVIAKCMEMGMMVTINARLDFETIQILADEFGYEAQLMEEYEEEALGIEEESQENLQPRHPVVTVMGHVDHGKTSLLDWIRKTHVVSGESGGITQHIGAYEVTTKQGKVTFLDTPGHEAFSAMRARGSQVTDVIVLVVAADSMVMPQTVECIELAKRENVPMVVAITKMDLPTANPDKIRAQLAERGVEVEQWGGQTSCIEVSARTG